MCRGRRREAGPRPLPRLSTYRAPPRDGGGANAPGKKEGEEEEVWIGKWELEKII